MGGGTRYNCLMRLVLGILGFLLVFASAGILGGSGMFPRMTPDTPIYWPYVAVGAPMFMAGTWMAHKAGYRSLRPFAVKARKP